MAEEGKRVTLTNRWKAWYRIDPVWACVGVGLLLASFVSLCYHFCFFMSGTFTGIALICMIVFASLLEGLFIWRAIAKSKDLWWWVWFWVAWIMGGVAIWEIASYFFGSRI